MKKFILLILVTFIISGCTLIPKKSSPSEANKNTSTEVETNVNSGTLTNLNVNNQVSTTTSKIIKRINGCCILI